MEIIRSQQNKLIKNLKKLYKKKYREAAACYLIEGHHLVEEALRHQPELLEKLVATEKNFHMLEEALPDSAEVVLISEEVSESLSVTPSPQGIYAVMKMPKQSAAAELSGPVVLLDGVQDPGNVGTIIRTADAAGYSAVILGEGSADLYNDKVLRSMQGSQFHLPVFQQNLVSVMQQLKKNGYSLYGTMLDPDTVVYNQIDSGKKFGIILGNEGSGVSPEVLALSDQNVYIPIAGHAESLNVAVAAGILMYQFKK